MPNRTICTYKIGNPDCRCFWCHIGATEDERDEALHKTARTLYYGHHFYLARIPGEDSPYGPTIGLWTSWEALKRDIASLDLSVDIEIYVDRFEWDSYWYQGHDIGSFENTDFYAAFYRGEWEIDNAQNGESN